VPTIVLDLLKYVFLAVLYIFIARAVKAAYMELRGPNAPRRAPRSTPAPTPARPPARRSKKPTSRVTVIEGENHKGKSFDVGDELLIGRADKCRIVLDDAYVSQMHARIFARDDAVMVEDLGSTNGTYVNRSRISAPTELHRGDQVKIGKTVLEMRK
jgi:pSer/pThr/pTyr-binding forkhead associated (FHA) protein